MVESDVRGWLPVMGIRVDYVSEEGGGVFNAPAHIVTGMAGTV
jgi:hypothetical protein